MEIVVIKKRAIGKINRARADRFAIIDVTSKSASKFKALSPMVHVTDIDVPGTLGKTSKTVEGAWQGLKVFDDAPEDIGYFSRSVMLKRKGKCRGHRYDGRLLGYAEARKKLYIPMYRQQLDACADILKTLTENHQKIALLDYFDNGDVDDVTRPLAHASLVKEWLLTH
jgi:hypothetical protein